MPPPRGRQTSHRSINEVTRLTEENCVCLSTEGECVYMYGRGPEARDPCHLAEEFLADLAGSGLGTRPRRSS